MIIARFGDDYDTAYAFPRAGEVDTWRVERPASYARVSGLPGAFDYFGDFYSPLTAMTFRKSFLVSSATYAAVQTAIDALKTATIDYAYESKLWLLNRGGNYSAVWAKCISLKISDQAGQIYFIRAEVEFLAREGMTHFV